MISEDEAVGFEPMAFPTLNPLIWRVIASGLWRQCEATNGTYDIDDLLDALEYLDVKEENERRQQRSLHAKHIR